MLVKAHNLKKKFSIGGVTLFGYQEEFHAVDDVSFEIEKGEVLGLVGESGSGKSTVGKLVLHLLCPDSGFVEFEGRRVGELAGKEMKNLRSKMQIIFQDSSSSLNPRMTVENIVAEPVDIHKSITKDERKKTVFDILERVGLREEHLKKYPHQLSGGQRQRVSIARAVILSPRFIVADEPVSALDVSVQSQILNLLMELKNDMHLSFLFISHDLSVVKCVSDRVAVMHSGKLVEVGPAHDICHSPHHPYTKSLLSAVPDFPYALNPEP